MTRSDHPDLHGLLVIDKPRGITSHDVVDRVRRLANMRRVGHGGTLDPFATGVLPVALGRATRVLQYLQNSDKAYVAHVALGVETDSGDIEGTVITRYSTDSWPSRARVLATLDRFLGESEQIPPAHSAIKVGGQPLYARARAGKVVDVPPRRIVIHALELRAYDPPDLLLGVRCGKGLYVRALARDIGRALGTYAYCAGLRRTQTGPFCLGDAWTLDELTKLDLRERWPEIALHPDAALGDLPATILDEAGESAWYHGRSVGGAKAAAGVVTRAYGPTGVFLGVGVVDRNGRIAPSFVLRAEDEP